jgi:hypothetical protein
MEETAIKKIVSDGHYALLCYVMWKCTKFSEVHAVFIFSMK